ncbi:MAG TPA: protein kinase, partial [bacterium]|nr:protein kinase [bacterium]
MDGPRDREAWRRIADILDAVLELDATERGPALDRLCGNDAELRAQVDRLVAADASAGEFLESSAERWAADLIGPAPTAPDDAPGPGDVVGSYRILREVGRGGMGAVYLAERADGQFDQRVALKLIRPGMDTRTVRERFLRERQILAGLQHPGVARLLDGGVLDDGRPFFALEYVEGEPLADFADRRRLPVAARVDLFRRVCDAVAYAQRRLVVHRDIKPSNVLV